MGWNTTVVVLNDGLRDIENDPEFGRNLVRAIMGISIRGPQDVPAGNHCNPCRVIESHHADSMVAVLVGGNCGQVLGYAGGWNTDVDNPEHVRYALEALAAQHGYRIVARSRRRGAAASVQTAASPQPASASDQTET